MESLKIQWLINHKAWDKDWNLLFDETFHNIITKAGKAEIANLAGNVSTPTAFSYLANWSGTTAATSDDTTLQTENDNTNGFGRASATVSRVTTTSPNDTLQLVKQWTATWNVTVNEIGIFNAASVWTMLWRQVLWATKNFGASDTYQVTYKIIFS